MLFMSLAMSGPCVLLLRSISAEVCLAFHVSASDGGTLHELAQAWEIDDRGDIAGMAFDLATMERSIFIATQPVSRRLR